MRRQVSVLSTVGVAVIVAAVMFVLGIQAQNTTLGAKISDMLRANQPSTTANQLPDDLNYAAVEQVYDVLRKNYFGKLTEAQIIESLKEGVARSTDDPYTVYLNAEAAKEFQNSLNNEFSGIGAEIAVKNEQLQIVAPLRGTPADRAGLRPGDPIIEIDGESTEGITVEEAVTKIRGEEGTTVVLTIVRSGSLKEVEITRAFIEVPNANGEVLDGRIGYIDLDTFGEDAVREVRALASEFRQQQVRGIILDLRGNAGGLLNAAVDIAGLWLENQVVVEQRGNQGGTLHSNGSGILSGLPTVVLIDQGSASASEIVAGALQDHGAAELIGQPTFGKGSVQSLKTLPGGAELKVTIARWYTPDGRNIDEAGITPDIEVELTEADFNNDRDPQLERAKQFLLNP